MSAEKNYPITVLLPVYNGEKYLRAAMDSILNQTFRNFELLVINDGSTDTSEQIILSYKDERIRYVKNEKNIRLIATLNKGMELATGKYIARMDADDVCVQQRLQVQLDFMEKNPEVAICGSWFNIIGDEERVVKYLPGHNQIMLKMFYQCHFCHPSVIWRQEMIKTFDHKFDATFLHAEDYDFFVRVGERYKLANIQQVLLHYRHHEMSISSANVSTQADNSILIKKYLFGKLGMDASEDEIELFGKISQHEYLQTPAFVDSVKSLLEKMVAANEKTGFLEKAFFRQALGEMWFHTCYNAGAMKIFYSSPLAGYYPLSILQQIKFRIKPVLK